ADDVPIVALHKIFEDEHTRSDFLCVVDEVLILNSEVKPIGYTELQRDKDYVKVHFRAKKTINTLIKNGGVPDQTIFLSTWICTTLPLLAQTLSHFIALEKRINNLAGDYKCQPRSFKQARKDKFIRDLPDSPQLKKLLK
ncbi:5579_t:CDS:2, partial [Funneliformis caledonium]